MAPEHAQAVPLGSLFRIVSGGRRALPERLRVERAAERWDSAGGRGRGALHRAPLEPAAGDLHGAGDGSIQSGASHTPLMEMTGPRNTALCIALFL